MKSRSSWRHDRTRTRVVLALGAAALFSSPSFAPPDGVGLRVNKGPSAGQITLTWTGGQPMFDVYRAPTPVNVTDPGNYVSSTGVRTFTTGVGASTLDCFIIYSPCVVGGSEVCDGADNDCNGTIDDPGSESSCSVPNAAPACVAGSCVVGSCDPGYWDCNALASDGCERDTGSLQDDLANCGACNNVCPSPANADPTCAGGQCGFYCDPGWADCNTLPGDGCEADFQTDAQHCGGCNQPCPAVTNAAATCSSSTCGFTCLAGFYDCDANPANGCERDTASLQTDSFHCGGCGVTCTLPNAVAVCSGGACESAVASCNAGYYDSNNDPLDGCEYACTFTSSTDLPDDTFTDANCDGIDGDVAKAIFVSPSGNDLQPGTRIRPVKTVAKAIDLVVHTVGKSEVYLNLGTYNERVTLANGVSLYGGYNQGANWARNGSNVSEVRSTALSAGRMNAVECGSVTSPTRLDRLRITTTAAPAASAASNYGVYANGCTGLSITTCEISAGTGGSGAGMAPGANGAAGGNGLPGAPGACDGPRGLGSAGGTSSCGANGGAGGNGGSPGQNNGSPGAVGTGGSAGGNGGPWGDPGLAGNNGVNGATGASGTNGSAGSGGSAVTFWTGNNGGTGGNGNDGNGGGGGGGGGAQHCVFCDDGGGNGGGGGGAGGCGGTGAQGGVAGGGSFGVFLVGSTGSSVINTQVTSGQGGAGGAGGTGGAGGAGGAFGAGANTCAPNEVGRGGNGGAGGTGGSGGPGGGGAGGPSFCIYRVGTSVTLTGNTLTPGGGGAGGTSTGNPGVTGASGTLF